MAEQWTVLGGWGVAPDILTPVFGKQAHYLDINTFVAKLFEGKSLASDWQQRCREKIAMTFGNDKPRFLAGWSTGAMLALACAEHLSPDVLVLISATPSFCRTAGFRFGTRSSILATMRDKLATEPLQVVNDFRKQCGLRDKTAALLPWSSEMLADGLRVLEQLSLFEVKTPACPTLQIHGKDDRIIPYAAGKQLRKQIASNLFTLDAPHACFIGNEEIIRKEIDDFINRM